MPLPPAARALLDGLNFATVATVQPDGSPQTSVVWIRADGDDLLFSTIKGRRKHANLTRDPRVSVLVLDAATPTPTARSAAPPSSPTTRRPS